MKSRLFLVMASIVLAGCATGSHRKDNGGGFAETKTSSNTFWITFRGNGLTSTKLATDLALLRGAELARANGCSHFIIVGTKEPKRPKRGWDSPRAISVTAIGTDFKADLPPGPSIEILCFEKEPGTKGTVYEARSLRESIARKYGLALEALQPMGPSH